MTIKKRFFSSLVLLAVFLAACAPAASPVVTAPPMGAETSQALVPTLDASTQPVGEPAESPVPTVLAVATSRGPNLEATDPNTVNLAAGQLQLVEFFRFT